MSGHVVLCGLMGSGKSTVGRLLAALLDVPLRDSDAAIEADTGQTEQRHAREARHLLAALADPAPAVISAASSTIEDPACRAALAGAYVVWLRGAPDRLAVRFAAQEHRPAFGLEPLALLTQQDAVRAALYASVATLVLDAEADPAANAARIAAALRAAAAG
jgi:shikimate kinase